jgi:antitoxin CcdA
MATTTQSPKKTANLGIDAVLLRKAKALGIDLSATLEQALAERIAARQRSQRLSDNRVAIDAYNRHVTQQGSFGDGQRTF